ncbi:MAG: hypothetical protein AUJ00_03720 [Gemmatimonadetes bacterium 13_1_40CM_3_70_6]|nr:MAG: hypothetical protein AUJ00_03720 [Gemmatimonadetes bacterium 13_1_40CM_3_70_6]
MWVVGPHPTPHAPRSTLAIETGAGTVHSPRRSVGTRTEATSPSAPISTTAVAVPSLPGLTVITRVHTPSVAHVRFSA